MKDEEKRQQLSASVRFVRDEMLTPLRPLLSGAAEALSALGEYSGDPELTKAAEAAQRLADPALIDRINAVAGHLPTDGIPTEEEH